MLDVIQDFGVDLILFLFSQCFLIPVHQLIILLLLFISGVLKIHNSILNPFKLFLRIVILFKPFNSTGAISQTIFSTVIYFEWALTHRSFPRILPDSSFSGVILKFFSKCDVRMISISHIPSPRSRSNSFLHWFNLFNSSFRSAQQFLWHFSSSFSAFADRRSVSLKF